MNHRPLNDITEPKTQPDGFVHRPEILAPAGSRASFLAALAAGADAIYCGLKLFSARMAAENFTVAELAQLAALARESGVRVYIAMNTLVKPNELGEAGRLLAQAAAAVQPDGIIFQDLAFLSLAREAGYAGELHVSTLANISFPAALPVLGRLGVNRVVVPRELSVDEIRRMAADCPKGMSLEVFVHGALCYGVSGRCYWSSFLGGKSSLRGQCVQPCRRLYRTGSQAKRFFSCQDLSLDVLAKVLLSEPRISGWKIEGRKKGPHYVYSTVAAYRRFRDDSKDPAAKKEALGLLEQSLGRQRTHYQFLDQRPQHAVRTDIQTGSGHLVGKLQGPDNRPYLRPNLGLQKDDLLRFGYEDEGGHLIYRVTTSVPKKGQLVIHLPPGRRPRRGTPVFLIDRREPMLEQELQRLEKALETVSAHPIEETDHHQRRPMRPRVKKTKTARRVIDMTVRRFPRKQNTAGETAYWLSERSLQAVSKKDVRTCWWWLPPVVWPGSEDQIKGLIDQVRESGGRRFVLNAPWQTGLIGGERLSVWAGPFCNLANRLSVSQAESMGFSGVIVSPELGGKDYLQLASQSRLPIGIVVSGMWPLCISRTIAPDMTVDQVFSSPKGEEAWVRQYGTDYWVYPNWELDLRPSRDELIKAGFRLMVRLEEPVPRNIALKRRPGMWNWNIELR